jgi:DivIVA domain-containing protein
MALTPEQVLNKHFQTTQFRRGYEERDVDDFLDEVVAEMRSLIEQRDDYLKQLNDCRASKNQGAVSAATRADGDAKAGDLTAKIQDAEREYKLATERATKAKADADAAERAAKERIRRASERSDATGAAAADDGELDEAQSRLEKVKAELAEAQAQLAQVKEQARAAASQPQVAQEPGSPSATNVGEGGPHPTANAGGALDAAGVIALAQRLHDEHVAAGESRRDQLIAEAEGRHAELLSTGQARHDELISTAQARHDDVTAQAEQLAAEAASKREQLLAEASSEREQMLSAAAQQRDQILTEASERSTGMIAEAQQKKAAVLEALERQKALLDRKIGELRGFEKNYRANLKSYIESQLHELDDNAQEPAQAGNQG